jgi:hypothetical protein
MSCDEDPKQLPNETTRQAIEELEAGQGVKTHSIEEFLQELDMSN